MDDDNRCGCVLPSIDVVMRAVLTENNIRATKGLVQGSTNWAASIGMAVLAEVVKLNPHSGESSEMIQMRHERDLLGTALGECIVEAGIVAVGTPLSGPQLLMFADDLKEELARKAQQPAAVDELRPILKELRDLATAVPVLMLAFPDPKDVAARDDRIDAVNALIERADAALAGGAQ